MNTKFVPRKIALAGMVAAALIAGPALADRDGRDGRDGERSEAIKLLKTIPIPASQAPLRSFDISWIDADTQMYYLADRSNSAVQVIDAKAGTYVKAIKGGFAGVFFNAANAAVTAQSGPNGVTVSGKWLFATDAGSHVVSIDTTTGLVAGDLKVIGPTGAISPLRADEMAYDPASGTLLVINNADTPPFGTFVSVNKSTGALTQKGPALPFDTAHGVNATNGAEQPVWDARAGKFFLSIPQIGSNEADGGVARIDISTASVETVYPVKNCQPAGLTLGPREDLLVGCGVAFNTAGASWTATSATAAAPVSIVIDARDGSVDATVAGVSGSDEVWYNRGNGNYYLAARNNPGGPVLGVIDAGSKTLTQLVPTVNTAANTASPATRFPAGTAHSVAVNPRNNQVFVPLSANNVVPNCLNGCIAVYGSD